MATRFFRKIQTSDTDVMKLQNQVEQVLNPTLKFPLLDSVEIKDLVITTAGLAVEHGLGRVPSGWIITDINADANVWKTAATDLLLTLDASASATISLLIY